MGTLWLLMATLGGLARGQECATATTTAQLEASLEAAESAYIQLDPTALDEAVLTARGQLVCLGEELPRSLAARTHRALGLGLYGVDDEAAKRSFAAARGIEPGYRFPAVIAVEGNPLHDAYMAIDLTTGTYEPVPAPAGRVTFDGRDTAERPAAWPTIVQVFDVTGSIVQTALLEPGDPMPSYALRPPDPDPIPPGDRRLSFHLPPSRPLLVSAGGALLASGALYGAAYLSGQAYADPAADPSQLDPLRARTNGLLVASFVGGGAAVALGAGAFLVGEF